MRAYGYELVHGNLTFFGLLRSRIGALAAGCMLLLVTNLIMAILPLLINGGVSLIEKDTNFTLDLGAFSVDFISVYWILSAIVSLAVFAAIIRTLSRMVIFNVGRDIERDVRGRLFFQISALDDQFFLHSSVGDLMNHLTTDVTNIRMVTGFAALNIINIIFVFCLTIPLLLKIDPLLAICALLPFPLVMIATSGITKRMFFETKAYQESLSELVSHVQENLLGAHVVRLFHQQEQEGSRFKNINKNNFDAGLRLARARALMQPVMRLMVSVAVGIVLYLGGKAVISHRITLGDFVEVNMRILKLSWPAMSV